MITLIRMIRLWQLKTKWKLAFWQFVDKQGIEFIKNSEGLEKKILPYLVEAIYNNRPYQSTDESVSIN